MTIGTQTVKRAATGRWTITVNSLVAGDYLGVVYFTDQSGTHAATELPIEFTVSQAPTPTSTPTPLPSPTKTKAPPVDSCAGQIRN